MTKTPKIPAKESAVAFANKCRELGWTYSVGGGTVVTIEKRFSGGNNHEFCVADSEYFTILDLIPRTSAGSIWGTDGGGIGAITSINNGVFREHKSGCSKAVLNALRKGV